MTEPLNRLSEFVNKLTALEVKRDQDLRQLESLEKRLEALPNISEKISALTFKIEALQRMATQSEQKHWEVEDSLRKNQDSSNENKVAISKNVDEIKRLYSKIDATYVAIETKLEELHETIKSEYLSNATFTKMQRNLLWTFTSGAMAIAINLALKRFGGD